MWFIGTGQFAAMCLERLTRRGLTFARIITGNPTMSDGGAVTFGCYTVRAFLKRNAIKKTAKHTGGHF
ncbi:MAG: hypothetical protein IJR63_04415 [Synergistaceae bacterium]|nr:hypothetical protein [Synergistaceae bacterium]